MPAAVKFGVTLPQIKRTWEEARDAACEFDALGYDSVWVCDHVYGVPAPQLPILEAWTELAAVAAITENVELGTLVTPPFFRNPAVLAKQVATIDHISGGRIIVGLGAGWFQAEFESPRATPTSGTTWRGSSPCLDRRSRHCASAAKSSAATSTPSRSRSSAWS